MLPYDSVGGQHTTSCGVRQPDDAVALRGVMSRITRGHVMTGVILFAVMLMTGACAGRPKHKTAAEMSALPAELNAAGPLLNSLNAAVPGLSHTQSILAAGSLMGLARMKMPPTRYPYVATAIPGSDALIVEATRLGVPSSAYSGRAGVTQFLGTQGISPDQVNKMIPVLNNAVKGKVSPSVEKNFMNALK